MAEATIHPVDDRIFVKRFIDKKTEGGLHVPDVAPNGALRGSIVSLGPGMPTMDGGRMALTVLHEHELVRVAVGDGVIYTAEVAEEITLESGKYDTFHFRDAIAVLKTTKSKT